MLGFDSTFFNQHKPSYPKLKSNYMPISKALNRGQYPLRIKEKLRKNKNGRITSS
jgi:hypothetical protein